MINHIPDTQGKQLRIERLSGYTNITYAVLIDNTPLYIFKVFADGLDRQTENNTVKRLADLKLAPRVLHAEQAFRI